MLEISHLSKIGKLKLFPREVKQAIQGISQVLDDEYGADRDQYKDNGGYVIVIEQQEDFQYVLDKAYIDCNTIIPEYVDKIECSCGQIFTNSLILCNNDYAISLIIPMELTPQNLKNYIID